MAIADDCVDAGQFGDFLRRALRVTSGDQDARGWVFASILRRKTRAVRSAWAVTLQVLAMIRRPGLDFGRGQAAVAQLGAYDFAVCPAGPTSGVLDVVFCHVASLINGWIPAQRKANSGRIR